jgi:hypothetical protein
MNIFNWLGNLIDRLSLFVVFYEIDDVVKCSAGLYVKPAIYVRRQKQLNYLYNVMIVFFRNHYAIWYHREVNLHIKFLDIGV